MKAKHLPVKAPGGARHRGDPVRIVRTWFRQELMLLLREPVAVLFSLVFPLVIFLFIGVPYADQKLPGGVRFIDVMFPALVATVASNLLLMGLPIYLSELRTRRVILRYRSLPLPNWAFWAAMVGAMLTLVLLASTLIVAVVGLSYGLRPTMVDWRFILLMVGLLAWLSCLGLLLGTIPVGGRTVQALCAVVFFVMFFGSGAAVPLDGLPDVVQKALEWNPLRQWIDVLTGIYAGTDVTSTAWLKLWMALPLTILCLAIGGRLWKRNP